MKKFFIMTIAIIFALSLALLAGCAGNPDTPDGSKTETTVTITAGEKAYILTGGALDGLVTAKDESGNAVAVTVNNDGGFDNETPGVYNVEFKAEKNGVTATKTVAVEVVGIDIDFPEAFVAGDEIIFSEPAVTITEEEYEVAASFTVGDIGFKTINFTDGEAKLTFESAGTYTIRASVTVGGTTLDKDVYSEGVTATADDSEYVAVTGGEFTVPAVRFSDNVSGDPVVSFRGPGDEEFTPVTGGKFVCPEVGYYEIRYTVTAADKKLDYIHETYARKAGIVMDFEGTDGTHYGMADRQWADNGDGAATLEVSDEWAHDGRYSLRLCQLGDAFWAGMIYNRPLDPGAEADTMVCYIYSAKEYKNTDFCVYTDETNYCSANFVVKKGVNKYFIKFDKAFSAIREFRAHTAGSCIFYIDSVEFGNYDVSNVLSLGEVAINGSALSNGDTMTLPVPAATSSIYDEAALSGGTMKLYASRDGEEEFEIEKNTSGEFTMTAATGTYRFRYVFECDGSVAERVITANVAKYDITASVPGAGIIGETIEISDIAGGEAGDEVTVEITLPSGEKITAPENGDKFEFEPTEVGYYEVYIKAQGDGKWGELTEMLYVRESDMAIDFEGVGEHRGYVTSYTENPNLAGYVPVTDEWAYDGKYSAYFNASSTNFWYGLKNINLAVPTGSNSVTFVIRSGSDYTKPVVWWVDTDNGSYYAEGFTIKAGVHSYTVKVSVEKSKTFGAVKQFAYAPPADDLNKPFYLDAVVFHPYTEFDAAFTRPEIKFNEEYTFVRPEITSDYLSAEEIEAIEMIVEYEKDGVTTTVKPADGATKLTLTERGIYAVTITLKNKYAVHSAKFDYAFGTIAINATLPEEMVTGTEYTFETPTLTSEEDVTGAAVKISYARKGGAFVEMNKKLGKYVFNVNAAGEYVIRYEATKGDIKGSRDYTVSVYQAGVFIDYESDGRGGWVETPYENDYFLPELTDEWAYDGTHSVKIEFRSGAWYGFSYPKGMYSVPQGTDKISVWVRSDRTFTYPSFIALEAWDSKNEKFVWYYMDEFIIEEGVNLYEGRLRLYGNLETYVEFTPALAGTIRAFTFHTEACDENSPDFGSVVYFDSIRFSDTDTSNFNDLTILPAVKGQEYTLAYASPSGFVDENLVISYRKPGETEWITLYESDAYDGEDITYTFDFAGKVDLRIIAMYGELFATYRGSITISE